MTTITDEQLTSLALNENCKSVQSFAKKHKLKRLGVRKQHTKFPIYVVNNSQIDETTILNILAPPTNTAASDNELESDDVVYDIAPSQAKRRKIDYLTSTVTINNTDDPILNTTTNQNYTKGDWILVKNVKAKQNTPNLDVFIIENIDGLEYKLKNSFLKLEKSVVFNDIHCLLLDFLSNLPAEYRLLADVCSSHICNRSDLHSNRPPAYWKLFLTNIQKHVPTDINTWCLELSTNKKKSCGYVGSKSVLDRGGKLKLNKDDFFRMGFKCNNI